VRALERPAFTNKFHQMGVTSIQTDPRAEHMALSGSYDEQLRLFDLRMAHKELCALALGGGIWCARWHPTQRGAILAACMHNGFQLARAHEGHGRLEHVGSYGAHSGGDSLAYGADWSHQPARQPAGGFLAATCSFYDHTLHLWEAPRHTLQAC
jgi:diphthamide biosynthesis protein 7